MTVTIPPAPKVYPRELPSWRLMWSFANNTVGSFSEDTFDDLVSVRKIFGIEVLLVSDPEGARRVLTASAENYVRPAGTARVLEPLVGDGLFLAEGKSWRAQRRLLAPVFTPLKISRLIPHFHDAALDLLAALKSTEVNLSSAFQATALEAVLRALFSLPADQRREHVMKMVRRYLSGPAKPDLFDWFATSKSSWPWAMRRRLSFKSSWSDTIDAIVAARREASYPANDLLQLLMDAQDPETGATLSDGEIRNQCATMLVAGFETTARALFWATYLLCLDKAVQDKIREEVHTTPPSAIHELEDLQNWPLLRQTLLETLRLYPPAPHIVRVAVASDHVAGIDVKAGAQVWVSPWIMHRHRRLWTNPSAFCPSRFDGQPAPWTSNAAFLPFGAGPRICIGAAFAMAEAQIVLGHLISRYRVRLMQERPVLPLGRITIGPDHEPLFNLESL